MDQQDKDRLLAAARNRLREVREKIDQKLNEVRESIKTIKDKVYTLPPSEVPIQIQLIKQHTRKTQELGALYPSPYFIKCEIRFDGEIGSRIFYFSKFPFVEENIYSWISPAAAVRFEKPGKFSYPLKDFDNKTGELISKEQYMIADGNIIFMASENLNYPRELIYQEYFSQRKSTFVLPEIVEQMEKAQDKVIRAEPKGSFLISGPAGSGKTTLALHRIAYLVQSPDTAEMFKESDITVFVQDNSTKEYFGGLLPQLGINNVAITTFADWARERLKLWDFKLTIRFGYTEAEKDMYEYEKYQVVKHSVDIKYSDDIFSLLYKTYAKHFSKSSQVLFDMQRSQRVLDRFDLTLLLRAYINSNKGFFKEETEYRQLKGGKVQRKKILTPLTYSLMVLDEVQNYLPEQIQILKSAINEKHHALVYVGDLAQQTQLCTVRDWQHAGENFDEDRKAVLQKNYRSTKQILEYINGLGFSIAVPPQAREGSAVMEMTTANKADEIAYVKDIANSNKTVVGVLAKSSEYLNEFRTELQGYKNVHVLNINEAQGVEFDVACLVGISDEFFSIGNDYNLELAAERKRVNKDLLYVALTRAMNELHVLGKQDLKTIIIEQLT